MAEVAQVEDWTICDDGPGFWAKDPRDRVSVWIEEECLHYETMSGGHECDIPLAVIARLLQLELDNG